MKSFISSVFRLCKNLLRLGFVVQGHILLNWTIANLMRHMYDEMSFDYSIFVLDLEFVSTQSDQVSQPRWCFPAIFKSSEDVIQSVHEWTVGLQLCLWTICWILQLHTEGGTETTQLHNTQQYQRQTWEHAHAHTRSACASFF